MLYTDQKGFGLGFDMVSIGWLISFGFATASKKYIVLVWCRKQFTMEEVVNLK